MKKILFASLLLFISCTSNLQCKQLITNIDLQNINYTKQEKDNCVTRNMYTILKINGINIDEEALYTECKAPFGGIYSNMAETYINDNYDANVVKIETISKESFIDAIDNNNIIFVSVKVDKYYNKSNRKGKTHYISIVGYNNGKFIILDTNRKELQGRYYDELMECISDKYTPCLYNLKK